MNILCFIFPFPMSEKVLQELCMPWQITVHPYCWVLEDRGMAVCRRISECVADISSQFCQVWHNAVKLLSLKEERNSGNDCDVCSYYGKITHIIAVTVPCSALRSSELLLKSIDGKKEKKSWVYLFWAEVLSFILPSTVIECANIKTK